MVKIFEVKTGKILHSIKHHTDWVTSVSFSLSTTALQQEIEMAIFMFGSQGKGSILFTLSDHKQRVTQMAWRASRWQNVGFRW